MARAKRTPRKTPEKAAEKTVATKTAAKPKAETETKAKPKAEYGIAYIQEKTGMQKTEIRRRLRKMLDRGAEHGSRYDFGTQEEADAMVEKLTANAAERPQRKKKAAPKKTKAAKPEVDEAPGEGFDDEPDPDDEEYDPEDGELED